MNKAMMVKELMQRLKNGRERFDCTVEKIADFFDIPICDHSTLTELIGHGRCSEWDSSYTLKHRKNVCGTEEMTVEVKLTHTTINDMGEIIINASFPIDFNDGQEGYIQKEATLTLIQPPCCLFSAPKHENNAGYPKFCTQEEFICGFVEHFEGMEQIRNEAQQCFNAHKNLFLEQIAIAQYNGDAIIVDNGVTDRSKASENLN